jgi:hypothetical protein
MQFEHSNS